MNFHPEVSHITIQRTMKIHEFFTAFIIQFEILKFFHNFSYICQSPNYSIRTNTFHHTVPNHVTFLLMLNFPKLSLKNLLNYNYIYSTHYAMQKIIKEKEQGGLQIKKHIPNNRQICKILIIKHFTSQWELCNKEYLQNPHCNPTIISENYVTILKIPKKIILPYNVKFSKCTIYLKLYCKADPFQNQDSP